MAMDVASLVSMVNQVSSGAKPSNKTHGGFNLSSRRSGGFTAPWQDRTHLAMTRSVAKLDPRISFINQWNERESGWRYRHPPLVRITDYDRILDLVKRYNDIERIQVTAPPGTYERQRQLGEQMSNPLGMRERRKTVREALTGRK